MERIILTKNDLGNMHLISKNNAIVYKKAKTMYKILKPNNFDLSKERKKILASEELELPLIERPEKLIYMKGKFSGYSSNYIDGIPFSDAWDKFSYAQTHNLSFLADILADLENLVISANKEGIVMPDLGNLTNLMLTKNGFRYIDYSGLQVASFSSDDYASLLASEKLYYTLFMCKKYICKIYNRRYYDGFLFTSELDKKTLIYIFFYLAFGVLLYDIKNIERVKCQKELFKTLHIKDADLMEKISWLWSDKHPNEFIAKDILRLAKDYKIVGDDKRVLARK